MLDFDMGVAGWGLTAVALSGALVRLTLGALAVHTTRKLLTQTTDRAHHLAVLRALLGGLRYPRR